MSSESRHPASHCSLGRETGLDTMSKGLATIARLLALLWPSLAIPTTIDGATEEGWFG